MKSFTPQVLRNYFFLCIALLPLVANAQTYCTPNSYYGDYYGSSHDFSFTMSGGLSNINWTPGSTTPNGLPGMLSYDGSHTSSAYYGTHAGEGYLYVTTTQEVVTPGTTLTWSLLTNADIGTYYGPLIHSFSIDWNGNGNFTDAGENVFVNTTQTTSSVVFSGSITVPPATAIGLKRLRLMSSYYYYGTPGTCWSYSTNSAYATTWIDFNFIVTGPCGAAPSALSVTSAPLSQPICTGATATISASDPNFFTGLVTKWQQSLSASGPWTNVPSGPSGGQNVNGLVFTTPALVDTTYFRVIDSCTITQQNSAGSGVYAVPIVRYNIPYLETFNTTANNTVPTCYVFNDNYGTNFTVQSGLQSADGSTTNTAMYANDPATNTTGKNDFFTLPGLKLTANTLYAIRFKYARGRSNPATNTGNLYPEHLQLFVNNYQPQFVVANVTGGNNLFDQTISFNNLADTTVYFTPLTTGGYYFSWYSNTAHPSTANTAGGVVIVDSVYVGLGTCVAPAIVNQPAATQSGCVGTSTTFSVVSSGTGNNYQWQYNGSAITGATGKSYTIANTTVANAGTYTCVITNPCGTVTTTNDVLSVFALPTNAITPSAAVTICSASGYMLTANTNAVSPVYQWKLNGTTIGTGSTYTPTLSGLYTVVVTDVNNCSQLSANTDTITVNASPTASISPSGSTVFCTGSSVTLFGPTGSGLSYQWYNGTAIPGATTSSYVASTNGNYTIKVSNSNCTLTSPVQTVSVNSPPLANIIASGPTTICQGNNVVLSASTGAGYTYTWRLNGSPTAISSANDTITAAGSYSVVTAIGSCTTTSTDVVVNLNAAPNATVSPSGTVSVCTGGSVVLSIPPVAGNTYQWQYEGFANGITTPNDTVTVAGDIRLLVTNSLGCSALSGITTINIVPLPVDTITPSAPAVCSGSNVTLNANTGTGLSYQWIVNGNVIAGATGASYTDLPLVNTPYQVVETNSTGCVDTSIATTITVNALPASAITPAGNLSVCTGGSVVLNANGGATNYQWQLNGVNIAGAGASGPSATFYTAAAAGNYTVLETNAANCSAISAAKTVVVNSNPTVTVTSNGPTTFCPGGSVILTATTVPAPPGYTYKWLNGTTVVGTSSTFAVSSGGSFRVVVTKTLPAGCFDTSSVVAVTLFQAPSNIIAPAGPTTFCEGASVVLNTAIVAGINYQWLWDGINITGATSSSYTATTTGSYTVTVSNAACSSTTAPVAVTANPLPTATVSASGPTTFCSNESLTLNAGSGVGYTYQWQRAGINVNGAGATAASYTTVVSGAYSVLVTDANGCSASSTPTVNVTVNPAPSVTATIAGSAVLCQGDTVHLYANSGSTTGLSYQWQMNSVNLPGALSASYYSTIVGAYDMDVIAKSANGCYDTSAPVSVTINAKPVPVILAAGNVLGTSLYNSYQWYLNGVAIPGATGENYIATQTGNYTVFVVDNNNCSAISQEFDLSDLSVNGVNYNSDIVKIYPNPATSVIHIDAPMKVDVRIRSIEGRDVLEGKGVKDMDISKLPDAVYMIIVSDASGAVIKYEKLVKTGL